jgi:two-component system LytT family response regulator
MKKLKALIVDDEAKSRNVLANLLSAYCPEIEIVGTADNGNDATKLIKTEEPDILFLDIEMKGETGFDLIQNLSHVNFDIIFTTAHDKYAIQAIRFSALDYLMKPILAEDLKTSVKRVFEKQNGKDRVHQLDALVYNINYSNADKKLVLPTSEGYEFISISEVIRCESSNNYTCFYLKDKTKLLISKTLMEFERLLSPYYFLRVHQSHLINLRMIKKFQKGEGGILLMEDGTEIDVSRRKKAELMEKLTEFAIMTLN